MSRIKCAVIGVGYLGRFHAQKYQLLSDDVELVAICDVNQEACERVAIELNVPGYTDYRTIFGKVDAVSIAATTRAHFAIAEACLSQGIHVLLEKPMTETVEQANKLIQLAHQHQVKLQVGHLERFNAARMAVEPYMTTPLFIDSQRLAPFTPRGADVNVILDLMIHDIDLIQSMIKSPIVHIDALGAPILSAATDIASARLTFENGCVANVVASRISFKTVRKTRIFQPASYISIDYQKKQFAVFEKGDGEMFPGIPNVAQTEQTFETGDALRDEIRAFIACIKQDTTPLVTGVDGRDALATAAKISELIDKRLKTHQDSYQLEDA